MFREQTAQYDESELQSIKEQPDSDFAKGVFQRVNLRTRDIALFAVQREKSKKILAEVRKSKYFTQYGPDFDWVDSVDYSNTDLYSPDLQKMSKSQLFLLELFFQTKPQHQTHKAKQAVFKEKPSIR